jgi:hypothetical protein
MTSKVDAFGLLIDKFSSITQQSQTDNFSHLISFTKSKGIKDGDSIIPEVTYSGAKLSKENTSMVITTGDSYSEYTNYENIAIKSVPVGFSTSTADVVAFTYAINNINQDPYNSVAVSHDPFEKIDPNYSKDELEFKVQLSNDYEVSIVFAKAPPGNKVRYPELFNETIHGITSFWDYTASSISDICEDELVKSNERIVYVRIKRANTITPIASGSFKNFTTTSLGRDGRFAVKHDIVSYMAKNKVTLIEDSNGYVFNELMYPMKSNNTIVDMSKIVENNKLYVKFYVEINEDAQSAQVIASIYSEDNQISLYSESIPMPYFALEEISSTLNIASKTRPNDITIDSLEVYTDVVADTVDPTNGGRYAPPNIYLFINELWGNSYIDSSGAPVSVPFDKTLSFQALPSKRNVNANQIWTSMDGAPFTNTHTVTLAGNAKYGEHVFRAYVAGLGDVSSSLVVERVFTINPVLPTPVFTVDIGSGSAIITGTSDFDILYSTDGSIPDLTNRTNVAMYTKPLKITKKTIVKAVAVFEDQSSDIVEFVFDPDTLFATLATLPIVTLAGSDSPDGYTSEVLITFESYSGVAYYTLDGTDPLDDKNLSRRVYVEPFNVLPIGNTKMYLNVGVIEEGKRSASTYNA